MAHRAPSERRRRLSGSAGFTAVLLTTAGAGLIAYMFLRSPSTDIPTGPLPSSATSARATPPASRAAAPPTAALRTYTVRTGDSLGSIAQRFYGTSTKWGIIYDANRHLLNKQGGILYAGQRLVIPILHT